MRSANWQDAEQELDKIDREVMRQLAIMNLKGATSASEMEVLEDVDKKVDRLTSFVNDMSPPILPEISAVSARALAMPHRYVERAAVQQLADGLTNPEEPRTPYTVVGMGGGGRSVLASAVVRKSSVRKHFREGIFWMMVGRDAKNSLLPLLQGLAREMGAAPTDTPHGVPHIMHSLKQAQQHLSAVASTGNSPRLVVLDDVWEREVVDALLPLELKVLLTTRDRSVVGVPARCLELGDMTGEEASELLLKMSRMMRQPGDVVQMQMTKVIALCGRLPLVLAIAGSMPVVKGKGLTAGAWEELANPFEDVAKIMRARGEQPSFLSAVLEASFDALAERKQEEVLETAVLAASTVASTEMLQNLWETQDAEGAREEAEGLASNCVLQAVGGGGYRGHNLVLDFVKTKIKANVDMVEKVPGLQANFLGRLDVLKGCKHPEHGTGNQGMIVWDALLRSMEKILLFNVQSKFIEAKPLNERSQAIQKQILDPKHPAAATSLTNRVRLLSKQNQGLLDKTSPLLEEVVSAHERVQGRDHPDVASALNNRAEMLKNQGKYDEAEPLFRRSLAIHERVYGPDHQEVAKDLNNWAELLKNQGKFTEAAPLYERSQATQDNVLDPEHPDAAQSLSNRAYLLQSQGKFAEAEPLYKRATEIWETVFGSEHPHVAKALNNLASWLEEQALLQVKFSEADPLNKRTQDIFEHSLRGNHPDVATFLNNRALLLENQGKYAEAKALFERCQAINE
eukprot:g8133.t2